MSAGFTKVMPTKSELLRLKRRLAFLRKGHDLLQLKADSLLVQIKNFYKTVKSVREAMIEGVLKAFKDLRMAETLMGEHALNTLADVNRQLIEYKLDIGYRSSLGFTVPKLTYHIERGKKFPHYSFIDTSLYLDLYYSEIQQSIDDIIRLAELENTLFIMCNEYRKIRRRINALENIIIPATVEQIKIIEDMLAEADIEEFIRLKKIKSKIINKPSR